jgi:hypothetical protein
MGRDPGNRLGAGRGLEEQRDLIDHMDHVFGCHD